ncbi:MAG: hypothetical protein ABSH01_20130 [Terriglobia bacterium]
MLTQDDAEAIADKLGCIPDEGRSHKYYELFVDDKLIARFGVRRASREKGHGHLPRELHITQKQCRDLSKCPLSKDEYLQILREKDLL